ncbi:MAG: MmcB family DNA repair protein [Hyphomicrobiaceae bacterium]|nr:MAG: MmcB family DNA repair protein [Hyphomicrobiaceae bacterium]
MLIVSDDGRQSQRALAIQRGAARALRALGFGVLPEIPLGNGRRADLVALNEAGTILIVEIKSCLEDFRSDQKWPEYRDFCDRLYFAVAPDFPLEALPEDAGLFIADRYGGELVREAPSHVLAAARRKAMLIGLARYGALRWQLAADPECADCFER